MRFLPVKVLRPPGSCNCTRSPFQPACLSSCHGCRASRWRSLQRAQPPATPSLPMSTACATLGAATRRAATAAVVSCHGCGGCGAATAAPAALLLCTCGSSCCLCHAAKRMPEVCHGHAAPFFVACRTPTSAAIAAAPAAAAEGAAGPGRHHQPQQPHHREGARQQEGGCCCCFILQLNAGLIDTGWKGWFAAGLVTRACACRTLPERACHNAKRLPTCGPAPTLRLLHRSCTLRRAATTARW